MFSRCLSREREKERERNFQRERERERERESEREAAYSEFHCSNQTFSSSNEMSFYFCVQTSHLRKAASKLERGAKDLAVKDRAYFQN